MSVLTRTSTRPDVSIAVPLYDEEDNVVPLCDAVRAALDGWGRTWELILVDDGSADGTRSLMSRESRRDPRVRAISLGRNRGQTLAMAAGFAAARGRVVVSMDGDLQNDPRDIPELVRRVDDGADVVCGWRKDRKDAFLSRTFPSKIANWLIARITGIPIHDNGCSLKAYRAEVIRSVQLYSEMHRFLPAMTSMTGARVDEVVVRHHPRLHGESKYGILRTFRVLADMITIKMVTQYAWRPGVWFGALALPWLVVAFVSSAVWAAQLLSETAEPSIVFPSLTVLFMFLFGSFLSLSMLSEMYLHQADRAYLRSLVGILTVTEELPVESGGST